MKIPHLIALATLLLAAEQPSLSRADSLSAKKYVIATVHPMASDAGLEVFRDGGNAIDVAVAAALTLAVVDGHNSGIGGGCLILVRKADGEFLAIDGRERAPAAATRDMFLRNGRPDPKLSQTGPLACGVPGALAAYQAVVDESGTMPLDRLLRPGHEAAAQGVSVSKHLASAIAKTVEDISQFEATADVLLHDDGTPLEQGERLLQPDLAASYAALRRDGIDWFYRGPYATRVDEWMSEHGGLLTVDDFSTYRAVRRTPVKSTYRDHTIVGFPPPSSGGVHVAQVLNMLEAYDLAAINDQSPPVATHVIAEAFSRAFADRAHWLGDSDYANVPAGDYR